MFIMKYLLRKQILVLVLFLTLLACVLSIANYHGNSNSFPGTTFHSGFGTSGDNHVQGSQGFQGRGQFHNSFSGAPHRSFGQNNILKGNIGFSRGGMNTDTKFSTNLAVYAILFFGLSCIAYFKFGRRQLQIRQEDQKLLLFTLLGVGLLFRIAIAPWIEGQPFDIGLFKNWAMTAAKSFTQFYQNGSSDYPPFYVYILYVVGKLASIPAMSSYMTLLIKLPSIFADILTAYLIYKLASRSLSFEMRLLVTALYTYNPAILINSTFWGQVDSFLTLLVVAALYLLSCNKIGWSAAIFTAALLMKPQGAIYLPVLLFELLRLKSIKAFGKACIAAVVTACILILPFSIHQEPLWLVQLYSNTLGEYPFASVNAFNFFSLLGANYIPDTNTLFVFSYRTWGLIFIMVITLLSLWIYRKGQSSNYASAVSLLLIAGVFTFSTSMHERYLFPAAALSLFAFVHFKDKRLLWVCTGFSATIFVNTYAILYGSVNGGAPYSLTLFLTSLFNVLLFLYLVKIVWDITIRHKTARFALSTQSINGM
jgi:Gpi18-like mannosyltransferase